MPGYVRRGRSLAALGSFTFLQLVAQQLVARAGGGKPSATPVTATQIQITTVATAADSVLLPAPKAGDFKMILNSGANSAQLFGAGTSTINGVATGTGVALAATKIAVLQCFVDGNYVMTVLN
jgi:hypothetical protein